jgi:hypothetical protein
MKAIDLDKIAAKNPKVDLKLTREYERLEDELERLGVKTHSGYDLAPPLGGVIPPKRHAIQVNRFPCPTQSKKP